MTGKHGHTARMAVVSALGLTLLLGTPLLAQADDGKWWKPKEKGRRIEARERSRSHDGYRGRESYRRGTWRGGRVRRDVIVIRDHRRGGYFRARRIYVTPRYQRHVVFVRPVRYFIAADACIGGVNIRARIVRPHYLYGCNFCDARFESYGAYHSHIGHCDHRPSGYHVTAEDWDYEDQWDGPYEADDEDWDDDYGY